MNRNKVTILSFVFTIAFLISIGCIISSKHKTSCAMTKSELEQLVSKVLSEFKSRAEIIAAFKSHGFLVTERPNQEIWAYKEVQTSFAISVGYDVFIQDSMDGFICREVRVIGDGP